MIQYFIIDLFNQEYQANLYNLAMVVDGAKTFHLHRISSLDNQDNLYNLAMVVDISSSLLWSSLLHCCVQQHLGG